ncbi:hypothetical protein PR202_gb29585 [Eleusine coracana subsp. coracana]|uniref:Uncharacterized protein n=1 Tax=Eleusine coracana subsp. coracana TaxID=191504 RepID=A0AAV5FXE4_ELECO|nr:hypothetical protein PR202_gb29585 [Eleusine coracana subsp. coracana]
MCTIRKIYRLFFLYDRTAPPPRPELHTIFVSETTQSPTASRDSASARPRAARPEQETRPTPVGREGDRVVAQPWRSAGPGGRCGAAARALPCRRSGVNAGGVRHAGMNAERRPRAGGAAGGGDGGRGAGHGGARWLGGWHDAASPVVAYRRRWWRFRFDNGALLLEQLAHAEALGLAGTPSLPVTIVAGALWLKLLWDVAVHSMTRDATVSMDRIPFVSLIDPWRRRCFPSSRWTALAATFGGRSRCSSASKPSASPTCSPRTRPPATAEKWARDDAMCRGHIVATLSDRLLPDYVRHATGQALWERE